MNYVSMNEISSLISPTYQLGAVFHYDELA
jgi:hypothetical protein